MSQHDTTSLTPGGQDGSHDDTRPGLRNRLLDYLLRCSMHPIVERTPKTIATELGAPYSSVTSHLRQLTRQATIHQGYIVNPYRTCFCHEFRIALELEPRQIRHEYEAAAPRSHRTPHEPAEPLAWFCSRIVRTVQDTAWLADHLIITEMVILHGAPPWDVEIALLTDDGIFTAGRFARDVLAVLPAVKHAATITVAWRYSINGYSGRPRSEPVQPRPSTRSTTRLPDGHPSSSTRRAVSSDDPNHPDLPAGSPKQIRVENNGEKNA